MPHVAAQAARSWIVKTEIINKEFFDKIVPDTYEMWQVASKITGVDLANGYRSSEAWRVYEGLAWLATATEQARGDNLWPWSLRVHGLVYKPSNLGGERDWPVGTTCWYVTIEGEHHWFACAETQHLAVLRGIVLMHTLAHYHTIAPHLRRSSISETMQEIIAELVTDGSR
jgi:hypothetical protein